MLGLRKLSGQKNWLEKRMVRGSLLSWQPAQNSAVCEGSQERRERQAREGH